ncbi:MAG: hypothetical protein KCHDKBKB_00742 [Elusimicrobia bacterium]|nr:hypothetical protein [Elusimicrobiota bacterium]
MTRYKCNFCQQIKAKYAGIPCDDCLASPEYKQKLKEESDKLGGVGGFQQYREATALGHDKITGQPYAIDEKGNRFDPKETRYNTKTDPHGWKGAGITK